MSAMMITPEEQALRIASIRVEEALDLGIIKEPREKELMNLRDSNPAQFIKEAEALARHICYARDERLKRRAA